MYIDIHNHCLPKVDDGARSLEESLTMVKQYRQNQIEEIIVTPHFHYRRGQTSAERILEETLRFTEVLQHQGINFRVHTGNEIYYSHDVPDLLSQGKVLTLAGSSYALIEFSPGEQFRKVREGLYEIVISGFYPILAHAERIQVFHEDISRLYELTELGAYIQMNITDVKSEADFRMRRFVKTAIENELVHFLATDAHGSTKRTPQVDKDMAYIRRKFGEAFLKRVMYDNPRKIIENKTI